MDADCFAGVTMFSTVRVKRRHSLNLTRIPSSDVSLSPWLATDCAPSLLLTRTISLVQPPIYSVTLGVTLHSLFTCCLVYAGNPAMNDGLLANVTNWDDEDQVLSGMTSLAVCGIEDPVRPEVSDSS